MTKFNKKVKTKIENKAGGLAYKQSNKLELIGNLLTSFVQDQFYRSESKGIKDLKRLIENEPDKKFVAKAAIYARNTFGMRSITHITAAELANSVKGESWTKDFYSKVIHRPDDITEILSYYLTNYGKPIPNALKKGLANALTRFDAYSLSKYKGEGKDIKLVDAINLLHPIHTEAISQLIKGTLKPAETWETKISATGVIAQSEEELKDLKKEAWSSLIKEKKLGEFALLRNLRNILLQAPDSVHEACAQLTNEEAIKKSLILPFRFDTAIKEIEKTSFPGTREVIIALSKALEVSLKNVPIFEGKTLVVIDSSGSMAGRPGEIATLFGAMLYKSNDCDLMIFSDNAKYLTLNPTDSVSSIKSRVPFISGGTNFHSIFQTANKAYKRIIILSDMQGWVNYDPPTKELNNYQATYSCKPYIYSWNLAQQDGTLQFPESNIFCLAGFSEKCFDLIKFLETDRNAIIKEIEKIELNGN